VTHTVVKCASKSAGDMLGKASSGIAPNGNMLAWKSNPSIISMSLLPTIGFTCTSKQGYEQ
jgi:hypothetical protein